MYKPLMETTVVKFQNVSSLSIILHESSSRSSQTHRDSLLVNAYTSIACASNLRTLNLFTRSTDFNNLFPLTPSMLTSLEEVTLTFSGRHHPIANIEAVLTFFQAIASTLTTLNITFSWINPHIHSNTSVCSTQSCHPLRPNRCVTSTLCLSRYCLTWKLSTSIMVQYVGVAMSFRRLEVWIWLGPTPSILGVP